MIVQQLKNKSIAEPFGEMITGAYFVESSSIMMTLKQIIFDDELFIFNRNVIYSVQLKLAVFVLLMFMIHEIIQVQKRKSSVSKTFDSSKKKSDFPLVSWYNGKPPIPFLEGYRTLTKFGEIGVKVLTDCTKRYGKTFRLPIGPFDAIGTGDVNIIQKILSSNDPNHCIKSSLMYNILFPEELSGGIFVSNFPTWLPHRKSLSLGFTFTPLYAYLSSINKHSKDLTREVFRFENENGRPLESGDLFAKYLANYLLRFSGDLITGPGTYSEEHITKIRENMPKHKKSLLYRFQNPLFFQPPLWFFHPFRYFYDIYATKTIRSVIKEMIINYKTKQQQQQDTEIKDEKQYTPLLALMLEKEWSEPEILDNFASIIFGEIEAAYGGFQFALLNLATNPEHQAICQKEIDSLFATKTEQGYEPSEISINYADLSELKYLERCIMESLRISPSIPAFSRELGSPLKINDNLEIGAGEIVMILPWILHRDPDLYPNPEKFDPDRFLPENVKKRPHFAYIPFSAGRRNCMGWKLSQIQLKVTLAWILRHFELSTADNLENVKLYFTVRAVPERNYNIVFKRRPGVGTF